MSDPLLEVTDLAVHYPGRANWFFQKAVPKKAVDGITFAADGCSGTVAVQRAD